jgi:hypothetical protein
MLDLLASLPSNRYRKIVAKAIVDIVVGDKATLDELKEIKTEIENAKFLIPDSKFLLALKEQNVIPTEETALAAGLPEGTGDKAMDERVVQAERISNAQSKNKEGNNDALKNPASRGVEELDVNPDSGKEEKKGKRKRGAQRNG